MKVTMIRKASNQEDWSRAYEVSKLNQTAGKDEVVIDKAIVIPQLEYNKMLNNLLENSHYITNNLKFMYKDNDGVWHCLKITARGSKTSLLVESEGYDYPRYTSIIAKK